MASRKTIDPKEVVPARLSPKLRKRLEQLALKREIRTGTLASQVLAAFVRGCYLDHHGTEHVMGSGRIGGQ